MTASESGPFLVSALIGERILTEQDNVHSLIRVVDRTIANTAGPESGTPMPKFTAQLSMFLGFKAGGARGSETVKVTLTRPNGLTDAEPIAEQSLHLALEVADYVYIMSKGTIVYESAPQQLRDNEEVKVKHLGV